jgi:Protein of unknown function (DUF2637)
MTPVAAAPGGIPTCRIGPADRWISRAVGTTVAALAGIAGALSYSHMRQLAGEHGQAGWHAHAFPLSVDGVEIVASLVLLADRRADRRSGWLPWTALAIGTAGSLAANVATAGPGMISRLIAGWPAIALLIAVKLLSGLLDRRPTTSVSRPITESRREDKGGSPATASETYPGLDPDIIRLLPAAREARDGLSRDGRRLTRDGLAERLRQDGHPVRNSRLTLLLKALRSETATRSPTMQR